MITRKGVNDMTKQPERLSRAGFRYLTGLLSKTEEKAEEEIENDGDYKAKARLTVRRITRIRLASIDLDEPKK
jgi:hypothetical protein